MKNNVVDRIKARAESVASEKINKELELSKQRIEQETKLVEDLCSKIASKNYVRETGEYSYNKRYKIATIEQFEIDYTTEAERSYEKGIKIREDEWNSINPLFSVNGIDYWHIGKLWETIDKKIDDITNNVNYLESQLIDKKEELEKATKDFKALAVALADYESEVKANE